MLESKKLLFETCFKLLDNQLVRLPFMMQHNYTEGKYYLEL